MVRKSVGGVIMEAVMGEEVSVGDAAVGDTAMADAEVLAKPSTKGIILRHPSTTLVLFVADCIARTGAEDRADESAFCGVAGLVTDDTTEDCTTEAAGLGIILGIVVCSAV